MWTLLGSAILIGFLVFGYTALQDWRENRLAERLEEMRKRNESDPLAASFMVDTAMSQSRGESDFLARVRDHRIL